MIGLIIPTHNRPNCLRRILAYYNSLEVNYSIVVADSSTEQNKEINKHIVNSYLNLYIQYINSNAYLWRKIANATNYIGEKYCVVCADDDFITVNGINQSVDFLEKNPDFTITHGFYIRYWLEHDKGKNYKFCWFPTYSHRSITFLDSISRLNYHLSNYSQITHYGVHRTDFMKMIFKETLKYTDDIRFGEFLPEMLTLIYGKMKCLNVLYAAREKMPGALGSTSKNLKDFMRDGTYEKKYNKFRNCLIKHLMNNSQINSNKAKEIIDKSMAAYLKKYYSKSIKGILIDRMSNLFDILDLPGSVYRNIRMLYRKTFAPRYVLNRSKEIDDFKNTIESPNSKYFDDFNKIRRHVLLHARNDN